MCALFRDEFITMLVKDFEFELPDALIARYPCTNRTDSRLLCLDGGTGEIAHKKFNQIIDLLTPNDLLVFNNTKVMPARLWGQKPTGAKIEILIERLDGNKTAIAMLRSNRSPKPDSIIEVEQFQIRVRGRKGQFFILELVNGDSFYDVMNECGHMPLPPYIDRNDEQTDLDRYQTVYAKELGAVAAPTAGLHFDTNILDAIKQKGIELAEVTLHVGAGTFQPVKVDNILDHEMHSEWLSVSTQVIERVKACKARGGRVIAVGTTSIRALESASQLGEIEAYQGDTNIFIYPGYQFKTIDALITNFHLPGSTLIMLVSALAGKQNTMSAYQEAIAQQYRFYSYGDAMFVLPEKADQHSDTNDTEETI
jgi:S-adenosylmethionine:tRNA ribosyltransferase-isomerase